jgi:hypothetical protein
LLVKEVVITLQSINQQNALPCRLHLLALLEPVLVADPVTVVVAFVPVELVLVVVVVVVVGLVPK